MARRRIVEIGDEGLRKIAKPVDKFDRRLQGLLADMADTMYEAEGVGLAAPQVGVRKRCVVVDVGDEHGLIPLVNPVIIAREGEDVGPEGCLSVPGRRGLVARPYRVTVRAQDAQGQPFEITGEGFLARAFCHELDHLDGVLYVDKMERELFDDEELESPEGAEGDEGDDKPGKDAE